MVNKDIFPLETEKLQLRPLSIGDIDRMSEICNDPVIHQFTLSIPYPYTREDAKTFIEKVLAREQENNIVSVLGIVEKSSGKLAGAIGLLPKHEKSSAEIGFHLGKEFRGKGLITEAIQAMTNYGFERLGFEKIFATVFKENFPSMRALESAGFQEEGFMKGHVKKGDQRMDVFLYGLLKDE